MTSYEKELKTSVATLRPGVAESIGTPWRLGSEHGGGFLRNQVAESAEYAHVSAPSEARTAVSTVQSEGFADANEFFKKLSALIDTLGTDIYKEDHSTMRSFKFNRKLRAKGFAWLAPKGPSLVVYLRKGDHSSVDPENKIILGKDNKFGGFPMMYIKKPNEVDYTFNIIKKIYNKP